MDKLKVESILFTVTCSIHHIAFLSLSLGLTFAAAPSTERGKHTCLDIHGPSGRMLYCTANVVVIRDLADPTRILNVFTEHKSQTTAAKFSPSGNYVCSGDEKGFVLIWNAIGETLNVKKQWDYPMLNGAIRDIAWTFDNERVGIVGDGMKLFAKVFAADTGSLLGEISGSSKNLLSCAFKPSRPLRFVTVGEEFAAQFYEGPPFKFKRSHKSHTSFVNCVRYSPNGSHFVTVSSDKKVFLYDGLTGDLVREILEKVHTSGIIYCDWLEDSTGIVTACSDKQVRIWGLQDDALLKTFQVDPTPGIDHQQVSVKVHKNDIYSVNLNGAINIWRNWKEQADQSLPSQTIMGHNNVVNQIVVMKKSGVFISSDLNGQILFWNRANRLPLMPKGRRHEAGIVRFRLNPSESRVYSFCNSQTLNTIDVDSLTYGEPKTITGKTVDILASRVDDNTVYLLQENVIRVFKNLEEVSTIKFTHASTVFDVNYDDSIFAIGDNRGKVLLLSAAGESLAVLEHYNSKISSIAFSKDGTQLLCGDSQHKVRLWDVPSRTSLTERLVFSSAMINSVDFSPNGRYILTSSLDNKAVIYDVKTFAKVESFDFAHKNGMTCATFGFEPREIITSGADNLIKSFKTNTELA